MTVQLSDSFDYEQVQFGKTPDNIQQICFDLCQQYLGGVWINLTIDEVVVRRLSGGLTNQLYYCAVSEDKRITGGKEPQEVAIRLYGDKHFNNYDNESNKRLTDLVIALKTSGNGLGPKVYGLFEKGQIQHFYRHRIFGNEERKVTKYMDAIARKLAGVHAMDVPIKKVGNWVFDALDDFLKVAKERFDIKSLIDESDSVTLRAHDLEEEILWLKRTVISIDSPQKFSHIDLMAANIMITESEDIILCDFEYSGYGPRGHDFGTFFNELGREWTPWGQWKERHEFPTDHIITPFIETYIEESVRLLGKDFTEDNRNSLEHILREVKVFCLVDNLFIILFFLKSDFSLIIGEEYNKLNSMKRIERFYKTYWKFKQQFINESVF